MVVVAVVLVVVGRIMVVVEVVGHVRLVVVVVSSLWQLDGTVIVVVEAYGSRSLV
jgi:hypothetical protein